MLQVTLLPAPPAAGAVVTGGGTRGAGDSAAGPAPGSAAAPGAGATSAGQAPAAGTPPPSPIDWRPVLEDQSARRAARAQESARENRIVWWAILTLAALLLAGRLVLRLRRQLPLPCPDCGQKMVRLDREAAFAQLDVRERTEQLVGDVLYEVWRCRGCGRVDKRGRAHELAAAARVATPPATSPTEAHRRRGPRPPPRS
ncbi:MAG TPA: hypothetical protein VHR45_00220 [Thermoanaerobaculia bacterium]|nr:hypothetical protein [Thermoanaerobaculia bacterium]